MALRHLTYLLDLPRFADSGAGAYRPGLERMMALLEAMGRPHEAFETIHVAGTNGKGSTASMVAAIGTAAGRRTGLHTSPHLHHLNERMRINGVAAPDAWIDSAVSRFRAVFEAVQPSFFEATVALSFLYFAAEAVEVAVVEVGLGGRLDATNVLHPRSALITSIGLDHTDLLGNTLGAIAREKAGIIKPGVPILTAVVQPEALAAIHAQARRKHAPLHLLHEEVEIRSVTPMVDGLTLNLETPLRQYEGLRVGLPGSHQATNAALAVRAAEMSFAEVAASPSPVYAGLCDVRSLSGLRGRLEVLATHPTTVADVAHNPEGLAAALVFMKSLRTAGTGRLCVLFGAMRDKDVARMARMLGDEAALVFAVEIGGTRAMPASDLAQILTAAGASVAGCGPAGDGLAWFHTIATATDTLLITGSHQVVSTVMGQKSSGFPFAR